VPTPGEERACDRFIAAATPDGGRFIVVHPGAGKKENTWPAGKFARVCRLLRDRLGLATVVVRGPVDGAAYDAFLREADVPRAAVSTPSVGFLGALMKRAVCTVCNDTGIMHIAGAVGASCVAVFGPTEPSRWKPVGEHVLAVRAPDRIVDSVPVEAVYAAVSEAAARSV
jgi:ADP-heptose:LPS heptosyltransferase